MFFKEYLVGSSSEKSAKAPGKLLRMYLMVNISCGKINLHLGNINSVLPFFPRSQQFAAHQSIPEYHHPAPLANYRALNQCGGR